MVKRLLGFLVVLVLVVILLALLPRHGAKTQSHAVPVAAVPIGEAHAPASAASSTAAVSAFQTTAATVPGRANAAAGASQGRAAADAPASGPVPSTNQRVDLEARKEGKEAAGQPHAAEPASGSGNYYVQVASFRDSDNAATALTRLEAQGYHGVVRDTTVDGQAWHRVQVGPYANAAAAQSAQRRMASQGHKGTRIVQP